MSMNIHSFIFYHFSLYGLRMWSCVAEPTFQFTHGSHGRGLLQNKKTFLFSQYLAIVVLLAECCQQPIVFWDSTAPSSFSLRLHTGTEQKHPLGWIQKSVICEVSTLSLCNRVPKHNRIILFVQMCACVNCLTDNQSYSHSVTMDSAVNCHGFPQRKEV